MDFLLFGKALSYILHLSKEQSIAHAQSDSKSLGMDSYICSALYVMKRKPHLMMAQS